MKEYPRCTRCNEIRATISTIVLPDHVIKNLHGEELHERLRMVCNICHETELLGLENLFISELDVDDKNLIRSINIAKMKAYDLANCGEGIIYRLVKNNCTKPL